MNTNEYIQQNKYSEKKWKGQKYVIGDWLSAVRLEH